VPRGRAGARGVTHTEAFVYVAARPGTVEDVYAQIVGSKGVRHADMVIGDWDVLVTVHGPDMATIALDILRTIDRIDGVARTMTVPVVPAEVLGLVDSGVVAVPVQRSGEACIVRIKTTPQATTRIFDALAEMDEVAGVAIVAGEEDIVVEIPFPWNRAAHFVIDRVMSMDGVLSTNTLIALPSLPVDDTDRDQFSAWS
jgi:DNA-binding Lrp family transcriptional regulator